MHIDAAGVAGPGLGLGFAGRTGGWGGVVLFQAQVPQGVPGGPQAGQQLVPVVLQGLQPGAGCRAHRENPALQPQGPAVWCQLGAGQPGPGLPEGGKVAFALPVLFQCRQAACQGLGGRPLGSPQYRDLTQPHGQRRGPVTSPLASAVPWGSGHRFEAS